MLVMGQGPTGARRTLGHTWRADLLGRRPWPRPEPWEPREVSEKGAPEPSGQSSRGGWVRRLVLGGAASLQKQPEPCGRGRRRGPVPAPHSTRAVPCWGSGRCRASDGRLGWGARPAVAQAGVSQPQQVTGSFLTHGVGGTRPKTQLRGALCPGNPQLGLSWA